ncbi:fatty acid-binding protein-like [Penaeus monodon]|uniref:fatty acid-binding protein-like n=1 Tax=Penaeus monodon TaxID=6687 RepID=UPI0018A7AFC0|nr:fatty acid-binding protein-like [Penaeus monodon]XP_037782887.1 fatty acid-binding protein-like [Penaeus monodon]XP_037782888.1 fatty acid-binding protein-like [Penaeus monodon]
MVKFEGTYKHDKDDNLEAVFAKMGMNFFIRKLAVRSKPTVDIHVNDDSWTITTTLPIKTLTWNFKMGQNVAVDGPEGLVESVFTLNGDTMMQTPVDLANDKAIMIERLFTEEGMVQTMTHKPSGTVAKRWFVRA